MDRVRENFGFFAARLLWDHLRIVANPLHIRGGTESFTSKGTLVVFRVVLSESILGYTLLSSRQVVERLKCRRS